MPKSAFSRLAGERPLLRHILAAVLGAGILLGLSSSLLFITFPYSIDYGEGALLENVRALSQGESIYRNNLEAPPYRICNYPPLYLLLQVPFMKAFGPSLWYGRLISWIGGLLAALFLTLTLHRLTGDRTASLLAGALLLSHPYFVLWASLCRVDALGLGLSWAAIYCLVRGGGSLRNILLVTLLLAASVTTKQSFLAAAPLAVFLWLTRSSSLRRAALFSALFGTAVGGLFLALNSATAGGFLLHTVFANMNEYQPRFVVSALKNLLFLLPASLVAVLLFLVVRPRLPREGSLLCLAYLVGSLLAALAVGKSGSNVNYLLELITAACLITGVVIATQRRALRLLLPLLIFQSAVSIYFVHGETVRKIDGRTEIAALAERVGRTEGRVLTDTHLELLTLSGRPVHFLPFEMTQLARGGHWDQSPLLAEIRRKEFSLILLTRPDSNDRSLRLTRWTGEMRQAIHAAYRQTEIISGLREGAVEIYQPRE